LREWRTPSA